MFLPTTRVRAPTYTDAIHLHPEHESAVVGGDLLKKARDPACVKSDEY